MINVILNDIIEIISGGTPKTSEPKYWDNGAIGWLSINDFNNDFRKVYVSEKKITEKGLKESNTKLLNVNDIIISARGTVGALAQIGVPMAFNQSCFGIRGKKNIIDNTYLYYALKNYVANIRKRGQGSVFNTINLDSFKIMEICIDKDYQSQQKIASILSALDDKIELNNKINVELEQMAKELYDYWFVQFDFPNEEGKPYKSSGGKMVYNEILKRKIPEGWEIRNIEDICEIVDCLHSKKPNHVFENDKYYLLQLNNLLDNGLIDISKKYYVSKKDFEFWTSRIIIKEHDILFTNAGRVAQTTQVSKEIIAGIGRNITAVRPKNICPTFCYLSINGIDIQKQIFNNIDQGAFFQSFNVKGIKLLNFIYPPIDMQKKFEKIVYQIRRKRELNLQQNQELASLRDWLLPMLMNGQVKVED